MFFVRIGFYIAAGSFLTAVAINIISLTGYDLSQLLPYPATHWVTTDPETPFALVLFGVAVLLGIPLAISGWIRRPYDPSETAVKLGVLALILYTAATMAYMAFRFQGDGPAVHNGLLSMRRYGNYAPVTPDEYHRAVALAIAFISSWIMIVMFYLARCYSSWFRNAQMLRMLSGE